VLLAGTAAAAVVASGGIAGGIAVAHRRRELPLTLAALRPLVGSRFVVDGAELTLDRITGPDGGAARDAAFRLVLAARRPVDLPGGVRTFTHAEGDLVLHTEPTGDAGTTVEAVVVLAA
jgi:hypothetical protein